MASEANTQGIPKLKIKSLRLDQLTKKEREILPKFIKNKDITNIWESQPMENPLLYPTIRDILIEIKLDPNEENSINWQTLPGIDKHYGFVINGFDFSNSEFGFYFLTINRKYRVI